MKTNRNWITGGLAATALVAVVGGTALAQSTPAPTTTPDAQTDSATTGGNAEDEGSGEDAQEPALNGSITAPEDESVSEDQESATLADLPGLISESDAITAATADGGSADAASLENENGSVVYEVAVTADDGTVEEVKVDAGTGDVLAREADDNEGDEGDEANEGPEGNEAAGGPEGAEGAEGATTNAG